jgi:hypothetical protein
LDQITTIHGTSIFEAGRPPLYSAEYGAPSLASSFHQKQGRISGQHPWTKADDRQRQVHIIAAKKPAAIRDARSQL